MFNVEQIDGLPESFFTKTLPPASPLRLIEAAEQFFAATGATIRHAGDQAYYSLSADVVVLPVAESFTDAEAYASTKAHELTHNAGFWIMPFRMLTSPAHGIFRRGWSA